MTFADRPPLLRRDYLLIPVISLTATLVLIVSVEMVARVFWPAHETGGCVTADSTGTFHTKPNCTYRLKNAEGPWVTYHFNECGYRSSASCGKKPAGTIRIALIGSSVAGGLYVPFEQTFGERASRQLSRATGRRVEMQNLGVPSALPLQCSRQLSAALELDPDLVVYAITPFDLERDEEAVSRLNTAKAHPNLLMRLRAGILGSRTVLIAQHFLFSNTENYLRAYLEYGDTADYLRLPLSVRWQNRFTRLSGVVADMVMRAKRHNVAILLMAIPSEGEAALLHADPAPAHTDPFSFGRAVEQMAERAGAGYVDVLQEFLQVPGSEHLFYVVDGHVNPDGEALLCQALVRRCLNGGLAGFSSKATELSTEKE